VKSITFENTKLQYRVAGKGDPVIFLHGFLENSSMWNAISDEIIALGFKTILVDLPCHGSSRFDGELCSMVFMAACVDVLCKTEGLVNPYVFGHSMGGYVGLELLNIRPVQLTLVHSNFWDDSADKKMDRNRVVTIVEQNKMRLINEAIPNLFALINREACATVIEKLIASASEIPTKEIVAATKGMRDRTHRGSLIETVNIQMIHGWHDPIVKNEKLNLELAALGDQPKVQIILKAGHMSIWECPTELLNYIKSNLGL
jgi:pimeloyl-ACP methyl ester carboxylesterase